MEERKDLLSENDSYENEPIPQSEDYADFDPAADYSEGLDEPRNVYCEQEDSAAAAPEDLSLKSDPEGGDAAEDRAQEAAQAAPCEENTAETAGTVQNETVTENETVTDASDASSENADTEEAADEPDGADESEEFGDSDLFEYEEPPKKKKRHPLRTLLLILVLLIAAGYGYGVYYFRDHFQMNTSALSDGSRLDISGWTQAQLDESLDSFVSGYSLTITDILGNSYRIKGSDISYEAEGDEAEKTLLANQNPFEWPLSLFNSTQLDLTLTTTYDEDALREEVGALDFMQTQNMTAPVNASVILTGDGYEVEDAVSGTTVLTERVLDEAVAAVDAGETSLTLTQSDYEQPEILADDLSITDFTDKLDQYLDSTVTYDIEGADEGIDRTMIMSMLDIDMDEETVSLKEDAVTSYVQTLATKYNTYGSERRFKTSLGDTITIGGGDYGWVISKSGEKEQLLKDLRGGEPVEREPVYEQTAVQRAVKDGETDIGDTYIEIDYTNQHIYYYKDGELQMDSDIVSGNTSIGNGSPDGLFKINYKKSPATLVGEDYQSDVTYFMVFSYNVGIHDASWRSSFGGSIYTSNGSHGCINVPLSFAKNLYAVLAEKTPVIAYYRNSVRLTSENARIANAYSYSR